MDKITILDEKRFDIEKTIVISYNLENIENDIIATQQRLAYLQGIKDSFISEKAKSPTIEDKQ